MDYTAIATAIISGVLSIGAVSLFLKNNMGKVTKYAMIAKDSVETLADVVNALKDGSLSTDEIAKLKSDVAIFQADLRS